MLQYYNLQHMLQKPVLWIVNAVCCMESNRVNQVGIELCGQGWMHNRIEARDASHIQDFSRWTFDLGP